MSAYGSLTMKSLSSEQGFTIIEVLVAIAILTIGIIAMITMQATSIKGNATANGITEATAWGADQMEQIIGMKYSNADLTDKDTPKDGLNGLNDSECCQNGKDPSDVVVTGCTAKADACFAQGNYFIYVNVAEDEPLAAAPNTSKTIRVIVNRKDLEGATKSVTFDYFRTLAM